MADVASLLANILSFVVLPQRIYYNDYIILIELAGADVIGNTTQPSTKDE